MTPLTEADVLVVVPALNEEATIGAVVGDLVAAGLKVLVVSDGSTDRTAEISRSRGAAVLELPLNLGVGGALRAGFRQAVARGYRGVIQVDADGQHPVSGIRNLIDEHNRSGAHFVLGSRFLSEKSTMDVGLVRRLTMKVLGASASRATGIKITDSTSGFRLICEPLLGAFAESFPTYFLGDTYEALVSAGRAGYVVREIPAALAPRQAGTSSASPVQAAKFTLKSLSLALLHIHFPIRSADDPR